MSILSSSKGKHQEDKFNAQMLVDQGYEAKTPVEELISSVGMKLSIFREKGFDRAEAMANLFPDIVMDLDTLESVVTSILSGTHILVFGPPGSGKTSLAKSIWHLYPKEVYVVGDCPVLDNPMSLVDEKYWEISPPCPFCKHNYAKEYSEFHPDLVDPESVPVKKILLHEGMGFARIQGSSEVFPDHLTGSINLHMLERIGDPLSPLVIEPGKLLQANRGILVIDEIGKLPYGTQNVLLQALEEGIVTPSKSRETFPSMFFAITTSNMEDLDNINEPLNDRLTSIYMNFPSLHESNIRIVDVNIKKRRIRRAPLIIKEISSRLIEEWRKNYMDHPDLAEVGSNRTIIDIIDRSISYSIVYNGSYLPSVNELKKGVLDSMRGRVRARSGLSYKENIDIVTSYLDKYFDKFVNYTTLLIWCTYYRNELKNDKRKSEELFAEIRRLLEDKKLQNELKNGNTGTFKNFTSFANYLVKMDDEKEVDPITYGLWISGFIINMPDKKCNESDKKA